MPELLFGTAAAMEKLVVPDMKHPHEITIIGPTVRVLTTTRQHGDQAQFPVRAEKWWKIVSP